MQALHSCMARVNEEVIAAASFQMQSNSEIPGLPASMVWKEHGPGGISSGIAGGVGSSIGATAANLYSSLQSSAGTLLSSSEPAYANVQVPQLIANQMSRVSAVLKTPIPLRHASEENLYGLNERIVAAESCWFVSKVFRV